MFSKKDIKFNGTYLTIIIEDEQYFVPTVRTYSLLTMGKTKLPETLNAKSKKFELRPGVLTAFSRIEDFSDPSIDVNKALLMAFTKRINTFCPIVKDSEKIFEFLGTKYSVKKQQLDYYKTNYGDLAVTVYNNQLYVSVHTFSKAEGLNIDEYLRLAKPHRVRMAGSLNFSSSMLRGGIYYIEYSRLALIQKQLNYKFDFEIMHGLDKLVPECVAQSEQLSLGYKELYFKCFNNEYIPVILGADDVYRISVTALCSIMSYKNPNACVKYHYKRLPSFSIAVPPGFKKTKHTFASYGELEPTLSIRTVDIPKEIKEWFLKFSMHTESSSVQIDTKHLAEDIVNEIAIRLTGMKGR